MSGARKEEEQKARVVRGADGGDRRREGAHGDLQKLAWVCHPSGNRK